MKNAKNREYELVMILKANISTEDRDAQEKSVEAMITKSGGSVVSRKTLGLKPIPYEIKKQREGHFLVWTIELLPASVDSFSKAVILTDHVLKHTVTIKDHRLDNIPALKKRPQEAGSNSYYSSEAR